MTKVIVGMSGGVDSSVAALLLKRQGYTVEGLFMKNWEEDGNESNCSSTQDLIDAKAVAAKLGIRLHTVNFATEYWDRVFTYFLEEYKAGRTPNPDILCNKEIKFKAFLDHALTLGADYIATGHYVRNCTAPRRMGSVSEKPVIQGCKGTGGQEPVFEETDPVLERRHHPEKRHEYQLLKGKDANKDQSYFLYQLGQYPLSKALFPVGELNKSEVRALAQETGLRTHDKKDSTGICFIGERRFKEFLSQYLPAKPGKIETTEGQVVGQHDGLMYHTIGQRKGLHIGGLKNKAEAPWYVVAKDMDRNTLIVAQGHDHPALFRDQLEATQLHWIAEHPPALPLSCTAKIRYRQTDQACTIHSIADGTATVTFNTPQRAITPGQSIVFYQDDICLGGGVINLVV